MHQCTRLMLTSYPVTVLSCCIPTQSLPNKHDDIEGLRIIRDPSTLVGKGIGYLLFKDRDCVLKALALHKVRFHPSF